MNSKRFSTLVLAAGKGSRMKSSLPKVLHKACGRSLLEHVLAVAEAAGATNHYVVVGHGRELVLEELGRSRRTFVEVWQKEQKGTGHAALMALPLLRQEDDLLLIVNGDGPLLTPESIQAILAAHGKYDLTLGVMELENPTGYGRVLAGKSGALQKIVEEKEASDKERKVRLVNGGLYVVSRRFLVEALPKLKASGKTGEIYLTDIVAYGVAKKKKLQSFRLDAEELLGVNDFSQLAAAEAVLRKRLCQGWMRDGVRVEVPEALWAEMSVACEPGVVLGPGVVLKGLTRLGAGVVVEAGAVLIDAQVEAGAVVKAYSHLEGAVVRKGAQVGPFARLRPGADIGPEARIGNFVEIKNASLGKGSKVNHLSYVGDAEIGQGVNIGCGFVACNYDGVNKHKTFIKDDAFVGSSVNAVAPITIGKGAYVATGSTINRDVPEGALAIARSKQENKEGYAARLRSRMQSKKGK